MIRNYEAMFIVSTAAEMDDQLTPIMDKYRQLVVENGGEVQQLVKWEKRRLAYEVAGQREGIYLLMNFSAESRVAKELDRVFRISDEVLRHIIVRPDEKHLAEAVKSPAPTPEVAAAPSETVEAGETEVAAEEVETAEAESPVEEVGDVEVEEAVESVEASEEVETAEAGTIDEDVGVEPLDEAEVPAESESSMVEDEDEK